ncbi:MAG: acyl-CoA dehydrogenase family protein, partial [Algoriella sp.]
MNSTTDYFKIDDLLTDEHKLIRQSVRDFVDNEIKPVIDDAAQHHKDIPDLMKKLGAIGALGPYIPEEYGGAGLDQMSYGLIMQELERGDSAVRSAASVQSSLVMYPIYTYGSEEQKRKFLPKLASGEFIGSFGLTEPNHGSNPGGMETRLIKNGDHYVLNGAKMWITNSPICDIAVVWAKDEEGKVRGVIVERGMQGFSTPETHNKWSLRASKTGELVFENVKIEEHHILPNVKSLKGPLSCLNSARYGIS